MCPPKTLEELIEDGELWRAAGKSQLPQSIGHSPSKQNPLALSFGLASIDAALTHEGLLCGATHEFYSKSSKTPLCILAALAVRAANILASTPRYTLWIGKSCWPNPLFLKSLLPYETTDGFFAHSLFIDPPNEKNALWSIEAALRCPAVLSVIAHIHNPSFPLTRRLSFAAKSSCALGLFVIGKEALNAPSAAATRWEISSVLSTSTHPRFKLSLLKQKGRFVPPAPWVLELIDDGERVSLSIPPDVVDSSRSKEIEETREPSRLLAAQR